ncbi:MAG: MFS transporter, partial [Candidatus Dormibacteraeota bacterium]|nr:MFS transporter [Candidatus Dormibacteraeota bacterium]
VKGFRPLLATALLSRTGLMMATVAFVLFALQRYHSATIAGLTVFLLVFPGLALSPINGALLDRFGRTRMMAVDLTITAASVLLIAALAVLNALSGAALLAIVSVASLTGTLSSGGMRALVPLVVPKPLWERANAVDVMSYGVAAILGPALAGALTQWAGGPGALVVVAALYLVAAAPLARVPDPRVRLSRSASVLRDARDGIRYVVRNRSLRWLALVMFVMNAGWGIVTVALPLAVFARGGGAGVVGAILGLEGLVGVPAAILGGRLDTRGRERVIVSSCMVAVGAATLVLLAPSLVSLYLGLAVIGAANGPLNIVVFALRQRRTAPAWFGRVFAISISLNYAGMPIGAALAGALGGRSLTAALLVAALLPLVSAVLVWNIPRSELPEDATPGAGADDGPVELAARRAPVAAGAVGQSLAEASTSSPEPGATRGRT